MNIFTRLLKLYKANSDKTPKEDFTTEIFVGILEKNSELLDDYVNNFLNIKGSDFEISSQCCYTLDNQEKSIIDMVIKNDEKLIFIENKIDSSEGYGQLEKYSKLLDQMEDKECHLCYCTKIKDEKEIKFSNFNQFIWKDIYDHYEDTEIELLVEFLEYLEEEGIVVNEKFNSTDLIVMENVAETFGKMEEVLNGVKPTLKKYFGNFDNIRSIQIQRTNMYANYKTGLFKGEGDSELVLGFSFNLEEYKAPNLEIYLRIDDNCNNYNEISSYLEKNKLEESLKYNKIDNITYIYCNEPISNFLSSETQIDDMKLWFEENLKKFHEFKKSSHHLVWK